MFILETPNVNKSIILESGILDSKDVSLAKKKGALGGTEILQLAMVITPVVITSLTTLIVTLLNSKKEFTLKANGKEISVKGFSKKEIYEMLSKLC